MAILDPMRPKPPTPSIKALPPVEPPFDLESIELPEYAADDARDVLTVDRVRRYCKAILDKRINAHMAAMTLGLPGDVIVSYLKTGDGDIAAGVDSRKAAFAMYSNQCEAAVFVDTLNYPFETKLEQDREILRLRCQWPEKYSDKRHNKTHNAQNSQHEELQRQLQGAIPKPGSL